ncbi:protein of unknown function [Desulfocicer vacuolatum DSM 3385]|uniref:DUF4340 domain-containing protein n=1 Tax=Desulfocicer vacuolatum DSM 3385 TaxID=1121400 RepID=A0A1W1YH71_9BACT|nr:DUF4340 domain-containing protein [Desulfocicer vacuolatum]SMC35472.1 protein of unknown function [Desulfocicer vacuolatum DSM 3385]
MKKEYLILALIIAGLCAYLVTHNENRNNYSLPELTSLAGSDITGITIEQKETSIKITKVDEVWGITEKSYPADTETIKNLVKDISTLKITALASEKGDLKRYQLDLGNRIKVTASGTSGEIRAFEVGKTAPSYHHTFVKIKGDDNIYHAAGNFRGSFDTDVNGLRNKKVLFFDESVIERMEITAAGITRTLKAVSPRKTDTETSPEEKNTATEDKKIWQFEKDNSPCDESAVKNILSTLSSLTCDAYTGDDKKMPADENPVCQITFNGENQLSFTLFDKNSNDKYPALSSTSPYPFVLDEYVGKNIQSHVETLLGIGKEEPSTPKE